MTINLEGRVAIVTGAGGGLGRAHALALAERGARVVVNDLSKAESVAEEIRAAGGQAIANAASVTDFEAVQAMVQAAIAQWGRVDILVNNAGILRDKSFAKMDLADFRQVLDVHLMGTVHCTKAVWEVMREQNYGRVIFTTSSSGLYGNFGQSNYGAAKMAMVGLMQTLSAEGARNNVRVNCVAPSAATGMTEGIMTEEMLERLAPRHVSPGVVFLASEDAPSRAVLLAGAGSFEVCHITMTHGVHIGTGPEAAERLASRWAQVADRTGEFVPQGGLEQSKHEVALQDMARR